MRALDKKLLRDLWSLRGQVAAIAAVVSCGIAVLVSLVGVYYALRLTQAEYYERYAFAQVFASLTRAPRDVARALRDIPGVAAVQTRVVVPVTLDLPGRSDIVTGRIVSLPETHPPRVNQIFLRRGRALAPGAAGEVLISEAFADANGLRPGDRIGIVVNGRWERPLIVGVAISPEYVYEVGPGELYPDSRRFGVLWMGRRALASAFDVRGAFNDVALRLLPGASEAGVRRNVDHILQPYGGTGAYGRHEQLSDFVVSSKIEQLRATAVIIPAVFLGVATFLAALLLARLVRTDRTQIGTLKAFGYSGARIAQHYLSEALVVMLLGGVVGVAAGIWIGGLMAELYAPYFHFPVLVYRISPGLIAGALLITTAAGLGGALRAARAAADLPPAEAMQPEAPASYRPTFVDALGIGRRLPVTVRMILRNVQRRQGTAATTVLGIALAVSLLVVGEGSIDGVAAMMDTQFQAIQRDDLTLTFAHVRSASAVLDVLHLPGVMRAEPFRVVAAELHAGDRSYRMPVTGIALAQTLRRFFDERGRPVAPPARGMLLSATVAEILRVRPGDRIEVDELESERRHFAVRIAGIVDEPLGVTAVMRLDDLDRRLGEPQTVNGTALSVDALAVPRLDAAIKGTPEIAGVGYRRAELENAQDTIGSSIGFVVTVLVFFAVVMSVGVVYNAARIALAERSVELATLRILGFDNNEVAVVLLGEHALLTALGIPLGIVLGYGLLLALVRTAFRTELYRVPFVITAPTCTIAVLTVATAAFLSAGIVRRRLNRLDLIAVLKGE